MLLPKPIWKDIKGYEGLYQINQLGEVRSLNYHMQKKVKRLKSAIDTKGYKIYSLSKSNELKTHKAHRLVAEHFIPNPNCFVEVNHKDENKRNACVWNLEWCTRKYNVNYGKRSVEAGNAIKGEKHPSSKKIICIETGEIFGSITDATFYITGKRRGGNICECAKGHRKTAYGFHWKYIDESELF